MHVIWVRLCSRSLCRHATLLYTLRGGSNMKCSIVVWVDRRSLIWGGCFCLIVFSGNLLESQFQRGGGRTEKCKSFTHADILRLESDWQCIVKRGEVFCDCFLLFYCWIRLRCFQEEREARELVKREQDEAYRASLLQDRAKVGVILILDSLCEVAAQGDVL